MRRLAMVLVAVTVTAAAVTATGCGGDDSGQADPTTTSPASPTTTTAQVAGSTTVIAHRGASAYAPEHTFAAYDLALEQGADYIEQDLQMTADGELVVLHDDTLDRTARGPADSCLGPVATKSLAQLQMCDVGTWFNEAHPDRADPAFVGLRIPTMREVLDRYDSGVRFYIETKSPEAQPGMEQKLLDLLDDAGPTMTTGLPPVIVQSFSADSLRLVHSLQPDVPLVLLLPTTDTPLDPAILDGVDEYAIGVGPSRANVDAALVDAAHLRCLDVHPYTVDDPVEMDRLIGAGVDGMFSNAPDVLREHAVERPARADCD